MPFTNVIAEDIGRDLVNANELTNKTSDRMK